MVDVPVRVTPLLGVLRGLEIVPLIRHVGRMQEAGSHGLGFLDTLCVAGGHHLLIKDKDLLHRGCRVLPLLSLLRILSRFGV